MKRTSKRMIAVLLAVMVILGSYASLGAFAAEDDALNAVAAEVTEDNAADAVEVPEAVGDPEPEPEPEPEPDPDPEVGKPTGLGKTSRACNNITLVWFAANNATGYEIYRCSADYDNGAYRKVGDVAGTTFNDVKLVAGCPYWYRVVPYTVKDGVRYYGTEAQYKTATQPQKLSSLTRARCSDVNEIKWNRVYKCSGYKVLRSSVESGNKEVLVATINGNSTTRYIDKNVRGGYTYTYNVVPIRVLYNNAVFHASGTRIALMAGLCAPNFNISSSLYRVSLNWKYNRYATRYDVYYSTDPNAKAYTPAGSTTSNSFTTGKLSGGKKLYFRVYPIYKGNGKTVTGTAHTKLVTVTGNIYGRNPGSTYIEINIAQQRMWFYKNGKLVVDTPVVTGTRYSMDTPKGFYYIYQRARNTVLTGPGYASPVDYWMAFCGGCGIHDASWRSSFGGNIYTYNGSHGCVNTPYSAVRTIYNNTGYDTPVIVY